jgi:D-psicose/D-tagatose/L-ribulose 3-epimerase
MRFGCCLNMVSTKPDGTGFEFIKSLAEIGFDYAELPLAEMTAMTEEDFDFVKTTLKENNIRCECCNNFFPKTVRLTGPEIDMEAILLYVEKSLGRASELNVKNVVFGSGGAKNVPQGFPLEDGYWQIVSLLKRIAPIAFRHNISIVIEPLRKVECNLINTFKEGCQLAQDVNDPSVKVLVDYYHMRVEDEPVQHIAELGKEYLRHIHFAQTNGRIYPASIQEDNYLPFINVLKEIGYNERISCEAYSTNFIKDAERTLKFFGENFE